MDVRSWGLPTGHNASISISMPSIAPVVDIESDDYHMASQLTSIGRHPELPGRGLVSSEEFEDDTPSSIRDDRM